MLELAEYHVRRTKPLNRQVVDQLGCEALAYKEASARRERDKGLRVERDQDER